MIFVFGSNLAGRHGKGAALHARRFWGAIYGQGEGFQGRSYAIPTKDEKLKVRSIDEIADSVVSFLEFALWRRDLLFFLTPVGCGYAGYSQQEILPLFNAPLPPNVGLSNDWKISL